MRPGLSATLLILSFGGAGRPCVVDQLDGPVALAEMDTGQLIPLRRHCIPSSAREGDLLGTCPVQRPRCRVPTFERPGRGPGKETSTRRRHGPHQQGEET